MAKMCRWHKKSGLTECDFQDTKSANPFGNCPRNTNSRCQIIPRREKMVRVKAWAFVFMGKTGRVQIDAYSDRNISHKGLRPCTILIAAKYLKGGKK